MRKSRNRASRCNVANSVIASLRIGGLGTGAAGAFGCGFVSVAGNSEVALPLKCFRITSAKPEFDKIAKKTRIANKSRMVQTICLVFEEIELFLPPRNIYVPTKFYRTVLPNDRDTI
jgi:hypothetical protein